MGGSKRKQRDLKTSLQARNQGQGEGRGLPGAAALSASSITGSVTTDVCRRRHTAWSKDGAG